MKIFRAGASVRVRVAGQLAAAMLCIAAFFPAFASQGLKIPRRSYGHERIVILYPGDQSTVFNEDGQVAVQILVSPAEGLQHDERIELFLNDERVSRSGDSGFVLTDLEPGPQRLRARIVSRDGATRARYAVHFYVWKSAGQ